MKLLKNMNKKTVKKIAIAFVIILFLIAFQVFDLGQYLTLSYIKESQAKFEALYAEHPAMVIVSYMILYILATSFSLPGAAILTLAGGALFGLLTGTVIVSFASTIGATIACFFSRFLLRDWIQGKFADRIQKVNEGTAKEGAFYLFTLRLLPVFPFWMINILMGLTTMPLFKFYWVSQLGMLPGTLVYVNAGKELAQIDSPGGILSPGLLLSFVLIGIFPLTVKKLIGWYRAKKGE
jgi:uncharacterized membrane protein YdjX (TVP38/TMEM64 family)